MLGTNNRHPVVARLSGFMGNLKPKTGSVCPHCAGEFRKPSFPSSALWQITYRVFLGSIFEMTLPCDREDQEDTKVQL